MCFSCICVFALYVLVLSFVPSSWCRWLAAVCDCGILWTFLLFFLFHLRFNLNYISCFISLTLLLNYICNTDLQQHFMLINNSLCFSSSFGNILPFKMKTID